MGDKNICCIILFMFIFAISICVPLITLNYVGLKPKFYIQEIYIPALNNSHIYNATSLNTSIFIDLKFKRVVNYIPLRYQDVNITLYYGSNGSFGDVGNSVVPGFSQGGKMAVHRKVVVEARALPWDDAFEKISGGSTVALTAELATRYMLKNQCDRESCSYAKPKTAVVAADLVVDGSGVEVSKKPIRLH